MEVKETACSQCKHASVCKFKEEFLEAQNAVNNTVIGIKQSDIGSKGQHYTRYLSDINYIEPVNLQCKHVEYKSFNTLRSSEEK